MTDTHAPIDPARAALLVMDFQGGIVARVPDPDLLLSRVVETVALARQHSVQVGYVRVAFVDSDYEGVPVTSGMGKTIAASGRAYHDEAPATQIVDAVAPEPGDIVVRKSRVGAFSTTDLHAQLEAKGIDTLILAGISTSGVILSTVRAAYDLDYRIVLLSDACADPDPETHAFLMDRLYPRQADVITMAELEGLLR